MVTQLEDLKKAVEVLSENPSDADEEEEHGVAVQVDPRLTPGFHS